MERRTSKDGKEEEERAQERKRKKELLHSARKERKRNREKQRRSAVSKGFEELLEVLDRVHPVSTPALDSGGQDLPESGEMNIPSNRIDLISRASDAVLRLYQEHIKLKERLRSLESGAFSTDPFAFRVQKSSSEQVSAGMRLSYLLSFLS